MLTASSIAIHPLANHRSPGRARGAAAEGGTGLRRRLGRVALLPLVLSQLIVLASAAEPGDRGDPPDDTTSAANVTLFTNYQFETLANPLPGQDRLEAHAQEFGAALTTMITPRIGARVFAYGDWVYVEAPDDTDGGAGGGLDLFVRDPQRGVVAAGYDFGWRDLDSFSDQYDHTVSSNAALFMRAPDIDWRARFAYTRSDIDLGPFETDIDTYSLDLQIGWYACERLQIVPLFTWSRSDFDASSATISTLRGGLAINALLLRSSDSSVTLSFVSEGGIVEDEIGGGILSSSITSHRNDYVFRMSLSVDLPGAMSLRELFREKPIGPGPVGGARYSARSL